MKSIALIRRSFLIALLALAPLVASVGCAEQDAGESVVKTTRLDETRQKQDSLKKERSTKKHESKPKIQSFGKHEPVDI
jgi:hypothetical protein